MEYRKFGNTDLQVSPICVGCMGMSGTRGEMDDAESVATLQKAFDAGLNFIDTSASYGNGHNHQLIAKAIQGRRDRVIIHSKSGSPRTPDPSGQRGGGSPEYLTQVCEDSLARLDIETLDVFCMSRIDPNVPVEESVGAMKRLVEQGKTRYIGLSEAGAGSIRRANQVHPIASLQMEYSLWSRDAETGGNLDACREFGMGFMAYSPLGRGFLAGSFTALPDDDSRRRHPRAEPGNLEHNLKLVAQMEEMAQEKSLTLAQLSLAWILAKGDDMFPIPGIRTRAYLEEDLKALDVALTPADLQWLDRILPPGAAAGPRTREMDRVNI